MRMVDNMPSPTCIDNGAKCECIANHYDNGAGDCIRK